MAAHSRDEVNLNSAAPKATVTIENNVVVHRVFAPLSDNAGDIYGRVTEVNRLIEAYIKQLDPSRNHWDILHTHDWLTGFAAIALKETLGRPLIATIHATERGRGRGYLSGHLQWLIDNAERSLIETSDRIIVCSKHMLNELQSFFQISADKMVIVPNGVDIAGLQIPPHNDLTEFRARYAKPNDQIVFTVSRLVHEKGVHRLVEATPRILADCPLARIVVAGKGPEAENLKRQAEGLGVADRINLIGFVPDEERNLLFKAANCAVFPSLYEPFGIVALEAMALGCPVVVSDMGGFSEVVTHTVTGITTYPDNPESVAWGVLRALTHPELARKYAAQAKEWVEKFFNWPRIALLTIEVYQMMETGL
jgi:glycosyltransferase involved in cell wall biosynthesis